MEYNLAFKIIIANVFLFLTIKTTAQTIYKNQENTELKNEQDKIELKTDNDSFIKNKARRILINNLKTQIILADKLKFNSLPLLIDKYPLVYKKNTIGIFIASSINKENLINYLDRVSLNTNLIKATDQLYKIINKNIAGNSKNKVSILEQATILYQVFNAYVNKDFETATKEINKINKAELTEIKDVLLESISLETGDIATFLRIKQKKLTSLTPQAHLLVKQIINSKNLTNKTTTTSNQDELLKAIKISQQQKDYNSVLVNAHALFKIGIQSNYVMNLLAKSYEKLGMEERAAYYWSSLNSRNFDKKREIKIIKVLIKNQQIKLAQERLLNLLKQNPNSEQLLAIQAQIYSKQQQYQKAINIYKELISRGDNQYRNNLVDSYAELAKYYTELHLLKEAKKILNDSLLISKRYSSYLELAKLDLLENKPQVATDKYIQAKALLSKKQNNYLILKNFINESLNDLLFTILINSTNINNKYLSNLYQWLSISPEHNKIEIIIDNTAKLVNNKQKSQVALILTNVAKQPQLTNNYKYYLLTRALEFNDKLSEIWNYLIELQVKDNLIRKAHDSYLKLSEIKSLKTNKKFLKNSLNYLKQTLNNKDYQAMLSISKKTIQLYQAFDFKLYGYLYTSYKNNGYPEKAHEILKAIYQKKPILHNKKILAESYLTLANNERNNKDKAINYYKKSLIYNNLVDTRLRLVASLIESEKNQEALTEWTIIHQNYKKIDISDEANLFYLLHIGNNFMQINKRNQSLQAWNITKQLFSNTKYSDIHKLTKKILREANNLYKKGKYLAALYMYNSVLFWNSTNKQAITGRVKTNIKLKNYNAIEKSINQASLNKNDKKTIYAILSFRNYQNDVDKAKNYLKTAIINNASDKYLISLVKDKKDKEAINWLNFLKDNINSKFIEIVFYIAKTDLLILNGQYEKARNYLIMLQKQNPNNDLYKYKLSLLEEKAKNYERSIFWLTQIKNPADYQVDKKALYNIAFKAANQAYSTKYFNKAIFYFNRALEFKPNDSISFELIGNIYFTLDDMINASLYWDKAIQHNPKNQNLIRFQREKTWFITDYFVDTRNIRGVLSSAISISSSTSQTKEYLKYLSNLYNILSKYYKKQNDKIKQKQSLDLALRYNENYSKALLQAYNYHKNEQDHRTAIFYIQKLFNSYPDLEKKQEILVILNNSYLDYANFLFKQNNIQDSILMLNQAVNLTQNNKSLQATTYNKLSEIYQKIGNSFEANKYHDLAQRNN